MDIRGSGIPQEAKVLGMLSDILDDMGLLNKVLYKVERELRASRTAAWDKLPKGWTQDSLKKMWGTLTKGSSKHKVTACIKKMDGKVTNPGAFCASLADKIEGKGWRSEKK
jgi:uncharacterized protein (DUF2126 family)